MSTIRADNFGNRAGTSSIPANTLLQGTAKAWMNLNGNGVIAVRDSFNVSSAADNGTGDYTMTFATALPDANYAFVSSGPIDYFSLPTVLATSLRMVTVLYSAATPTDRALVPISISGDP